MDLSALFPWILFPHVFGAILAFGPTYAFMIIGAMGGWSRSTRTSASARPWPSRRSSSIRWRSSRGSPACC